jgi:hypothetical protein
MTLTNHEISNAMLTDGYVRRSAAFYRLVVIVERADCLPSPVNLQSCFQNRRDEPCHRCSESTTDTAPYSQRVYTEFWAVYIATRSIRQRHPQSHDEIDGRRSAVEICESKNNHEHEGKVARDRETCHRFFITLSNRIQINYELVSNETDESDSDHENQECQHCLESQLIRVTIVKTHPIQFAFVMHLVQRQFAEISCSPLKGVYTPTVSIPKPTPVEGKGVLLTSKIKRKRPRGSNGKSHAKQ